MCLVTKPFFSANDENLLPQGLSLKVATIVHISFIKYLPYPRMYFSGPPKKLESIRISTALRLYDVLLLFNAEFYSIYLYEILTVRAL